MIGLEENVIVNRDKFISSGFGDEMMLMNLETGNYVGLNSVSADIWRQAENKTSPKEIIDHLLKLYNVDEEVCKGQVLTCMTEMLEKELLLKL